MVNVKMVPGSPKLFGAKALAEELGVTVQHLYKVRVGERRSPRIEAALKAAGVEIGRPDRGRKGGVR